MASYAKRGEKLASRVKYLWENPPSLVTRSPLLLDISTKLEQGATEDEAFFTQYVLGRIGSSGYRKVNLRHITFPESHGKHIEYRNEWWSFYGSFDQGYISVRFWRHTYALSPPRALLKVVVRYSLNGTVFTPAATVFDEESGSVLINNEPFSIKIGDGISFASSESQPMFPLVVDMDWEGVNLDLELNSQKSLFMFFSNGCTHCSDGVGMKKYIYPSLIGTGTLNGTTLTNVKMMMDHSWEYGLTPTGFPKTISIRSFITLDYRYGNVETGDSWLCAHLQFDNSTELFFYVVAAPKEKGIYNCSLVRYISEDGIVTKKKGIEIEVTKLVNQYPVEFIIRDTTQPAYLLNVVCGDDNPVTNVGMGIEMVHTGVNVSGVASGKGFIHITSRQSEELISKLVLNELGFDDAQQKLISQQMKTSKTDQGDVVSSIIIWLVPLLVILFLVMLSIYAILGNKGVTLIYPKIGFRYNYN
jgi:predicted secreted hydrolase